MNPFRESRQIDLNCDMGESRAALEDGTQEALMPSFSSVNVACGGHAGDETSMLVTVQKAAHYKLAVGAHPGYPDRENFGRLELDFPLDAVNHFVFQQVSALARTAAGCGVLLAHVKPHGALYNQAAKNRALARAIADGVARWSRHVVLVGLAGSPMLEVFQEAGFAVASEAFADRRYEPDGSLRSRKFPDALIVDPGEAGRQALQVVERGTVTASDGSTVQVLAQTLCLHSDTPGASSIAKAVATTLRGAGIELRGLGGWPTLSLP